MVPDWKREFGMVGSLARQKQGLRERERERERERGGSG